MDIYRLSQVQVCDYSNPDQEPTGDALLFKHHHAPSVCGPHFFFFNSLTAKDVFFFHFKDSSYGFFLFYFFHMVMSGRISKWLPVNE